MCFFIDNDLNDLNDKQINDPVWMELVRDQLDQWQTRLKDETTRAGAKQVSEYFQAAGLPADTDPVRNGWSAAFVAYIMLKYELDPPRSAAKAA